MATAAAVPAEAAQANEKTLSEALAAASISDKEVEKADKDELEDGEIKEEPEDVEDDGKPKTVFDDASRFNLKHPLYAPWTLYFDSPQSKLTIKTPATTIPNASAHGGWLDDMRRVMTFDSVEEFWGLYNNIVPPSLLPGKANYYLFKDGIIPAWEDAQNKNGGKWAIQVPRDKTKGTIDQMWLYTVSARGASERSECRPGRLCSRGELPSSLNQLTIRCLRPSARPSNPDWTAPHPSAPTSSPASLSRVAQACKWPLIPSAALLPTDT